MVKRWLVSSSIGFAAMFLGACTQLSAAPDIQIRSFVESHTLEFQKLKDSLLADENKEFTVYRKTTDTTDNTDPKHIYRPLMVILNIDWASKQADEKLVFAVSSAHDLAGDMCQTKLVIYSRGAFKRVSRLADSSTAATHISAIDDDWGISCETINSFDCSTCRRQ